MTDYDGDYGYCDHGCGYDHDDDDGCVLRMDHNAMHIASSIPIPALTTITTITTMAMAGGDEYYDDDDHHHAQHDEYADDGHDYDYEYYGNSCDNDDYVC